MQNNQADFDITLIYSGSQGPLGTYDVFNGSTSVCMIKWLLQLTGEKV